MEGEGLRRVARLRDLGSIEAVSVGTRVTVDEDRISYICIGNPTLEIARRAGWAQPNVWMPEHVMRGILQKHEVFPDPLTAAQVVLVAPMSVHQDRRGPGFVYFFILAEPLREVGLLTSRSTDFVDGVVELRHVSGGSLLRFFHLAPTDRNKGDRQLWP